MELTLPHSRKGMSLQKNGSYRVFYCDCQFDLDEFTATIDKDYENDFGKYFKTIHFHEVAE